MKTDLLALLRRVDDYLAECCDEEPWRSLRKEVLTAIAEMEQALGPVLAAVPTTALSTCCNAPIEDAGACAASGSAHWRCTACLGTWPVEAQA